MKLNYRRLVFTSILIGSLLVPLASHAAQVVKPVGKVNVVKETARDMKTGTVKDVKPELQIRIRPSDVVLFHSKCKQHYLYLHYEYTDTVCHAYVQPEMGSVRGQLIAGGYTCRFKDDFPPDNACPAGTTIERINAHRYKCVSVNPIDTSQMNCYQAEGYNFTLISVWEDDPNQSPGWANGFRCEVDYGTQENVCTAKGAICLANSVDGRDFCCVYLGE